jgi:NADPH:quinone reductase-like Zn-dependent oxidoreductase
VAAAGGTHGLSVHCSCVEADEGRAIPIHGASGGVGSLAAQIAVQPGARVIGSGSTASHSYLRSIGVEPVLYGENLVQDVRAIVANGVDTILDCVGRGVLALNRQLVRTGLRACSIADGAPNVTTVFARIDQNDLLQLVELVEAKNLTVPVAVTYPLNDAAVPQVALKMERRKQGTSYLRSTSRRDWSWHSTFNFCGQYRKTFIAAAELTEALKQPGINSDRHKSVRNAVNDKIGLEPASS